ncbi:helix-turn-helix domain-containing protein [Stenotrophomonas nitritireducens]|uniref:HTH cro/C1-type domain-containing protein n=1 Tax=Stenotrophomonas nitritireducens TaxID=83617 RepID=A0ABR5NFQ1_9GAMM|nr:helix-turn-helix transcriptional regulator [Stenotrophomonas nitritireducens]KRG54091.1 hypothetical protein ABB22_16870 [Stenotrophomonas nitritireducens]
MDWKLHIAQLISAGATPGQIAERIGVTANAIREIVAGRTKSPRADAAFKLARLTPADFVDRQPVLNSVTGHAAAKVLIDTRMSKRALRARLGLSTDKQLAKVLQLPVEQVEGWEEESALPAVPEVLRLLGAQAPAANAPQEPEDPDSARIVPVEVA